MFPNITQIDRALSAAAVKPPRRGRVDAMKRRRHCRLGLETLESRQVLSAGGAAGAVEPISELMQAAQMSAFFQQSALYSSGQPTGDPTVTWPASSNERPAEMTPPLAQDSYTSDGDGMAEENRTARLLPPSARSGVGPARSFLGSPLRLEQEWPEQVFAPYVDMGAWPTFDLVHVAQTQGIKFFTLAQIAADAHDRPSWAGHDRYALGSEFDLALRRQVSDLRALGGDVCVSFGGPRRLELAQVITDVDELARTYRRVIDVYGLRRIDFDLEGSGLDDVASVLRRSQALARLQHDVTAEGRQLDIWFTLPAEPSGLSENGVHAMRSAVNNGVRLAGVNIKAGNYEPAAAPAPKGRMGAYSIEAAFNAFHQLRGSLTGQDTPANAWRKIGITPIIGRSEVAGEDFSPREAQAVCDFARQQGLGMVGIWSLNRDQYDSTSSAAPDGFSSGVEQHAFEFSDIFKVFTRK